MFKYQQNTLKFKLQVINELSILFTLQKIKYQYENPNNWCTKSMKNMSFQRQIYNYHINIR